MPDTPQGQITLAVLSTKLDHIQELLQTHINEDHVLYQDHEKRIRATEKAVTQLDQRQRQATGVLAFIQLIVGGVAAWFGSRQ